MLCIDSKHIDPYLNLATEEFLLKERKEDIFIIWISSPSVIVGKHQNTLAEINYDFIKKNNIEVARRLSGGGTVYHDAGNINFTWILNGKTGRLVDFKKFINPVIDFLRSFGVNAVYGERNDILVNNKKVSGNAEHIYKNRTLHHGTLLFNTDLTKLRKALLIQEKRYKDKAVKSVPHSVGNINEFLNSSVKIDLFRNNLFSFILNSGKTNAIYTISPEELKQIEKLRFEKYKRWDWIFGYSPDYIFSRDFTLRREKFDISFKVSKGMISEVSCKKTKNPALKNLIKNSLENILHMEDSIEERLNYNLKQYEVKGFDPEEFSKMLF